MTITNTALEQLKEILENAGHRVYTKLEHVSKSGMTRYISVYAAEGGHIRNITWHVAQVLGWKRSDKYNGGIKVEGCGMDMGFHLIYNLSMKLYCPDGYTQEGAYKLRHEWL